MAEVTQVVSDTVGLSRFSFGGIGTFGTILLWVVISITLTGLICGFIVYWYWNRTFKEKAYIWATINGIEQKIAEYKAKWVSFGRAGDKLFYIRELKKYELPKLRTGTNEWNFHIRQLDGELINFDFENLDEKMKRMKMRIIDGDVRMQRLGIEKNLKDRHQKKRDWQQLIMNIAFIVTFVIIFIALVVLFSKLSNVAEAMNNMAGSVGKVAEEISKLIDKTPSNTFRPENLPTGELIPV